MNTISQNVSVLLALFGGTFHYQDREFLREVKAEILSEMRECVPGSASFNDTQAQLEHIRILAWSLARMGDLDEALKLSASVKRSEIKFAAYAGAASRALTKGQPDAALDIANKYLDLGWQESIKWKVVYYLIANGEFDKARPFLLEFHRAGIERASTDYLIRSGNHFAEIGEKALSRSSFQAVLQIQARLPNIDFVNYTSIPEYQAAAGFIQDAVNGVKAGFGPAYRVAMKLADMGEFKEALELARMVSGSHRAWVLSHIISKQAARGDLDDIPELIEELYGLLDEANQSHDRNRISRYLALALGGAGRIAEAERVIDDMENSHSSMDPAEAMLQVAREVRKTRQVVAKKLLDRARDHVLKLPESNRFVRADELGFIALEFHHSGYSIAAKQTLLDAQQIAKDQTWNSDGRPYPLSVIRLAELQAQVGDRENALESFKLGVKMAAGQPAMMEDAVYCMVRAKMYDLASQTAPKVDERSRRQYAYKILCKDWIAGGNPTKAITWIKSIKDPQDKVSALVGATSGFVQLEACVEK